MFVFHLQTVRCEEPGCTASLQQPYSHVVCRTHAGCAVRLDDLVVWHPDGCEVCFALCATIQDESADESSKKSALESLRAWVAGFGRNVPSGKPYVLDAKLRDLLYPGARVAAAVPEDLATPIIQQIRDATQPPQVDILYSEVSEDVAALNLDLEPMATEQDQGVSSEVGEVVGAGTLFDSPASSISSFSGFGKSSSLGDRAPSAIPKLKLKTSWKAKGYKSSSSKKASPFPPSKAKVSAPVASGSKSGSSGKGVSKRAEKPSPPRQPAFDVETFAKQMFQRFSEDINDKFNQISEKFATYDSKITEKFATYDNMLAGMANPPPAEPQYVIPDMVDLPPFDLGNPWRFALRAIQHDGKLTIEGLGTRRLEELEFFPADLLPPYPGFVRLTEEAWIRSDKVPRETVIIPRDQAQSSLLRTLTEWQADNTKLTPFKGNYTMFALGDNLPTPCLNKVALATAGACFDGNPLPQLRETDPTSWCSREVMSSGWMLRPTFTVGKLDPSVLPHSLVRNSQAARIFAKGGV
ncbi:uncharacterized protein [Macrobrachium rosenbergii]|uniref:uncharacterized protein n=1 Tax=Macrobrachium rosenbergii TaxID=79674 RepID=UPI0034D71EA1